MVPDIAEAMDEERPAQPPPQLFPLVMDRMTPAAWTVMPHFVERITAFVGEHETGTRAATLAHRFQSDFGTGNRTFLGIALIDPERSSHETIRGHLLACIEQRIATGELYAVVLQWEKDVVTDVVVDEMCQQAVDTWASGKGCHRIVAMAMSPSRVRLFQRAGYRPGPQLISREVLNNG